VEDPSSTPVDIDDWSGWSTRPPGRTTGNPGLSVGISVLALVVSLVSLVKVFSGSEPPTAVQKPPPSTTDSSSSPGLDEVGGPAMLTVGKDLALDLDNLPTGKPEAPGPTSDFTLSVQQIAGHQDKYLFRYADGTEAEIFKGQSRCLATNGTPPALACVVVMDVNSGAVTLKVTTWRFG
jgi:hypothetical protein